MRISDWSSDVCSSDLPDIALQPDARRFLEASRPGQAIALLTDGHLVSQQRKIEALGIAAYGVNPLVITGLWGRDYWKPHRRGFETLMAEYGLPPSAFPFVGANRSEKRRVGKECV